MGQIVILILLVLFDSSKYVEFRKPGASEDTHGSLRIGNLSRVGETSHIDLREILQSLDDMVYTRVGEDVVAASFSGYFGTFGAVSAYLSESSK